MKKQEKLNRIILIDDDKATNFINKKILTKLECSNEIIVFDDPDNAFNYLTNINSPKPDLIFLDINMPKMDGWEFVEKLSNDIKTNHLHIPTIILTSSFNPYDREKALLIPEIKELINKPLNKDIVFKILNKYFN